MSFASIDTELTRSSKSRVLISISCKILRTLMHSFSSEDISALVCWISLRTQTQAKSTNAITTPSLRVTRKGVRRAKLTWI